MVSSGVGTALEQLCRVLEADYEQALQRLLATPTIPEDWQILAVMTSYRRWQDALLVRREVAYRGSGGEVSPV